MDRDLFVAVARAAGRGATRRAALPTLAPGIVAADPAAARRKRAKRAGLGDACEHTPDCCKGLKCNRTNGSCVWRRKHGGRNHWRRRDRDRHKGLARRKNVCREV